MRSSLPFLWPSSDFNFIIFFQSKKSKFLIVFKGYLSKNSITTLLSFETYLETERTLFASSKDSILYLGFKKPLLKKNFIASNNLIS